MEQHTSLHKSLDESSKECDLTSWTKHVNRRGIVFTIRYEHKAAMFDPRDQGSDEYRNHITYKPKSRYHAKRDYMRMKELKNNHLKSFRDKNMCMDDSSHFNMQHSDTVPISINQNNSHLTTHVTAMSELETSCLSEHSQPMSYDSQSQIPSIERHHALEKQDLPPVELESIDNVVLSPVQLQSVSVLQPVQLPYAESISPLWPPRVHEPDTVRTVSITQERDVTMSPVSSDDLFPADYEIDSSPDFSVFNIPNTDFTTDRRTKISTIEHKSFSSKCQSRKDLICDKCVTTVPSMINMLFCNSCSIHLCGKCVLSGKSVFHSSKCRGTLSFIRNDGIHVEYVPTSTDCIMVSEMTQPPGSRKDSDDQKVPTYNKEFYNPLKFMRL